MLLLINGGKVTLIYGTYLNTSHVTVNPIMWGTILSLNKYLNTSHVTVNLATYEELTKTKAFKYISCYC